MQNNSSWTLLRNALGELGLTSLDDRRQNLTNKLFKTIINDPQNKIHHLLPTLNQSEVSLRVRRKFLLPNFKTIRCKNDFINCNSSKYIEHIRKLFNVLIMLIRLENVSKTCE
jgi:hypothetical protein